MTGTDAAGGYRAIELDARLVGAVEPAERLVAVEPAERLVAVERPAIRRFVVLSGWTEQCLVMDLSDTNGVRRQLFTADRSLQGLFQLLFASQDAQERASLLWRALLRQLDLAMSSKHRTTSCPSL